MAVGDLTTLANVKQWLGLTGLVVSAITNASPAVLTLQTQPPTPLLSGSTYSIAGSTGMALPDGDYVITKLTPTTFSIPVDSTSLGTYTGGATVGITDPLLQRLISAVSQEAQTIINRTIAQTQYIETRDGLGQPMLMFLNYPVTAVALVLINGLTIQPRPPLGPNVTAANFGGYVFDANRLMLAGGFFPRGFQNIQVQYTAGFATTPADLEQAVIDVIGDWFKYRDRIGVSALGIDGQSISLTQFVRTALPMRASLIIDQYRRVAPTSP